MKNHHPILCILTLSAGAALWALTPARAQEPAMPGESWHDAAQPRRQGWTHNFEQRERTTFGHRVVHPDDGRRVDVTGVLRTGIMAIGGETTGYLLTTADGRQYDLELRRWDFRRAAERLDGQQVRVQGTLRFRPGVTRGPYWVIDTTRLAAARVDALPPRRVALRGLLQHNIYAVGGETTRNELVNERNQYELDLQSNPHLEFRAQRLDGQLVRVYGTLTYQAGVERGTRRVVYTDWIESAYEPFFSWSPGNTMRQARISPYVDGVRGRSVIAR
jgi:hypothetical protein